MLMEPTLLLQAYLDEATGAVLSGDWAAYREGISLPCTMISPDVSTITATEADLRAEFDAVCAMLQVHQVTTFVKIVDSAYFLDKDLLSGFYVSHMLAQGRPVIPPYRSVLDLRLEGKRWRAAAVTNGLNSSRLPAATSATPAHFDQDHMAEGSGG